MPTYIALVNWTEQGARSFQDTVSRFEANRARFEPQGVKFESMYWTLGSYDMVSVIQAPDDETVAATLLAACGQGNIKTATLRAFNSDEMKNVISRAS